MTDAKMTYRRIGTSGLVVSEIALGSWLTYGGSVDADTAAACIHAALDAGVTFLDTADVYAHGRAEEILGAVLADRERSDLVIATKAYFRMSDNPNDRGLSRKHLCESIDKSLRRLRTDYVDLYQCHRYDEDTRLAETVRAMGDLARAGKILYWGVSCWTPEQIRDAIRLAWELGVPRPISNQPQYNMLDRAIEAEIIPTCAEPEVGMGQVVFGPLAGGVLTGKYAGGLAPAGSRATTEQGAQFVRPLLTERNLARVERLAKIAADAGIPLPRLALAWVLRQPNVASAIIGATSPEQVRENVGAADLRLPDDLLREIEMVLTAS